MNALILRLHRLLPIVAVNIALSVLLIALVEFLSSLVVLIPGGNLTQDARLNHTWRPHSSWTHQEWIEQNPDFPQPYVHHYNRQGWIEEYDIQKKKPAQTYRIFYLGDSFTEGTCPMNQSVPSIVERCLNARGTGGEWTFEVINTGTSSYSPTLFYLLARYVIADYAPDALVVNVDMTDDFDDWKYSQTLIRDAEGNPLFAPCRNIYQSGYIDTENGMIKATLRAKLQLFLMRHSYTYNVMAQIRSKLLAKNSESAAPDSANMSEERYPRWAWCQYAWDDATARNVNNTLDLLRRLALWCRQHRINMMLTGVPHYWQYAGNPNGSGEPRWSHRPHDALAALAKEFEMPYLDSYQALQPIIAGAPQTKFYYAENMHFNPRGYAAWAEAHCRFLTDQTNRLLPKEFWQ